MYILIWRALVLDQNIYPRQITNVPWGQTCVPTHVNTYITLFAVRYIHTNINIYVYT